MLKLKVIAIHVLPAILILFGHCPDATSQVYFQQEVNYKIAVSLNDTLHELNAYEEVNYTNNSPDTLKFMYFHLWPNAYSDNKTPLARQIFAFKGKQKLFKDPELRSYIDSVDFRIDNLPVRWTLLPDQPDICKIILNKPLYPGESILITTPFHVKIPKGVTSRLGHIDQTYQITQWFPKPAVYDRQGWHPISYLDQGEFYSELGRFDVSITLPQNYVVGATGILQDSTELKMLDALAADTIWRSIRMLGKRKHIIPAITKKTLHYTGENMHDFAWFADRQFNVMKGRIILPETGKKVTVWVMFTARQSRLWRKSLIYANQAILDFSKMIGDYPYTSYTLVQSPLSAGLGMEYPGLAVIGPTKNAWTLDNVIVHEIGHSWFYGALGFNERRYPFLDEGLTSSYENREMAYKYPEKKLWEVLLKKEKQAKFLHADKMPLEELQELEWLIPARNNTEQPLDMTSTDYNRTNYGQMVYNKTAMGFSYLRAYLGDTVFDAVMHDFYRKWKFRHPQPDDLRFVFENQTSKNLSWFFDDFIGTTKRLDYQLIKIDKQQLLIKNKGEMASPLVIAGLSGDRIIFEKWIDGFSGSRWIEIPQGNYTEIKIDPNHLMPELFRLNNNLRTSGLFPRADPVQPQLLVGIEDPEKIPLMYIPAVNWNYENGFMIGVALYNGLITPKPIEYFVMPFYSFNQSKLAGFGRIAYNITPYNNLIRMATISLQGTRFGAPVNKDFGKILAGLDIHFRKNNSANPIQHSIYGRFVLASDLYSIVNEEKASMNRYVQLGYNLEKSSMVNPYKLLVSLEAGTSFSKTAVDFDYTQSYSGKDNGLKIHFFAGAMLKNTASIGFYSLAPAGRSGRELYLYDGTYPNRFGVFPASIWSRQMTFSEGGLVSPVNQTLGYSQWLLSVSLSSSLPGILSKTGIKPFVNVLLNDHGLSTGYNSPVFMEAGLKAGIMNNFEIYVPLLVSKNIQSITGPVKDRIRFVLNLDISKAGKATLGN
ncbi:MAG: M1 family metallopeptidase [Paludibacteraceae bacterium]